MATSTTTSSRVTVTPAAEERSQAALLGWYDRSSIAVDAMVAIEDQSPEDFERHAPENAFCDYIDGVVYMPSPASDRHQKLVFFLAFLIQGMNRRVEMGDVMLGPAVLRLSERHKLEPDVFVKPPETAGPDAPKALLVIEALSNSTRSHDPGRKLQVYRDAGIPEIWIVDDLGPDRAVFAERRIGEGYRRDMIPHGRLDSSALPGFWIDVDWLWADPLPDGNNCLDRLRGNAGPPESD